MTKHYKLSVRELVHNVNVPIYHLKNKIILLIHGIIVNMNSEINSINSYSMKHNYRYS